MQTIGVRSRLSQAMLDNLAVAWSRLDRARPRDEADVPLLLFALDEWMRWAVRIDNELAGALGSRYLVERDGRPGGRPIPGLRHAFELTDRHGHPIQDLVTISAGSPALFYDVMWRRYEELPAPSETPEGEQAYRRHLARQTARTAASEMTTFLLTTAVLED